jgi:hypothetical protein
VFHTGQPGADEPLAQALEIEAELLGGGALETKALVSAVLAKRFMWGLSDGN